MPDNESGFGSHPLTREALTQIGKMLEESNKRSPMLRPRNYAELAQHADRAVGQGRAEHVLRRQELFDWPINGTATRISKLRLRIP